MYGPPGPLGLCNRTGSRGSPICHGVGGVSDILQRNLRCLPECLSATKPLYIPSCGEQIRKRTIRDILFPKRLHAKA